MTRAPRAKVHHCGLPQRARLALPAALLALAACRKPPEPAQPASALVSPTPVAPPVPATPVAAQSPVEVTYGPWLLDPQSTRMTVAWTTKEEMAGVVAYGEASMDKVATEPVARREHRLPLNELTPGRRYRYRVAGTSEEGSFWTALPPEASGKETPFRVLVYGDNRTDQVAHAEVAKAAFGEGARLALHTGDMVVDARREDLWQAWFEVEHGLLAATAFVPTEGNHEVTDHGVAYTAHFQSAGLPPYRSVDYGPLHIVVLDSFEPVTIGAQPREGDISDAQKAWLAQDLAAVPKDKHIWVLVHQGPFSHPLGRGHGGSDAVRRALLPYASRIEAVLAGHDHYYERGKSDGLRYFVLGGGGAPLYEPNPKAPGVQFAVKTLSYAVIDVCGCHVDGVVKTPAGKVIDSFQLSTCAVACPVQAKVQAAAGSQAGAR